MIDTIPPEPLVSRRWAGGAVVAIVLALLALCIGAAALPHDRYIRFQQFASGDISQLRYVYERLHYDRTPIDVAVIGSSRVEAAVSAPNLQRALSRQLGRPIHAAGLAVPLEGRDMHYVIAQELLRTHPEVRLIVLSLGEPIQRSHPAFRNVADVRDVLGSPMWLNYYWLENAAFLPYRQLSLFVQSLAPGLFGVRHEFEPARYRGTDFDATGVFRLENGRLIDRDALPDRAKMDQEAAGLNVPHQPSRLARITGADDNVIENTLTRRLAETLAARCTGLILVHTPTWRGRVETSDIAGNARIAPVLVTPPSLATDRKDYSDGAHLRRSGIDQVGRWLPGALKPYLGPLRQPPRCDASFQVTRRAG